MMRYTDNSKKTVLTPPQLYPMIWGCFGANLSRCQCAFRTKENKQNGTRSRELSSKLQRFVQLFRPLFSQYFKVVGVFVVAVFFLPHKV